MTDFTIPPEVVEAALRAYSGGNCECSSCRKAVVRTITAALKAWPGMQIDLSWPAERPLYLVLPLTENANGA